MTAVLDPLPETGSALEAPARTLAAPKPRSSAFGVDVVAVLERERADGGDAVGEHDQRERDRRKEEIGVVGEPDVWKSERWQPLLDVADDRDVEVVDVENGSEEQAENEDDDRRGHGASEAPDEERGQQQRCAQQQRRAVRLVELGGELLHDREEVVGVDVEPEHLPELSGDDRQRDPVDVAEQDRLPEEVGDEAKPEHSREDEDHAHGERESRGKGGVARRVNRAADDRQRGDDRGRKGRHRRIGSDNEVSRRTEDRVPDERQEGRVEPEDDRQPGELAHRERRRDRDDGHDRSGDRSERREDRL